MNTFESTVPQLIKMLNNIDRWLESGVELAKKKSFDPDVLLSLRLAPDQYSLGRQIQVVSDAAKFVVARLTGKQPPAHADNEKTMDEHRARLKAVVTYLEGFTATDFEGAEERHVSLAWMQGKWLRGGDYMTQFAMPNFYFHATTAYAILRHAGVDLGKIAFIGPVAMHDPEAAAPAA